MLTAVVFLWYRGCGTWDNCRKGSNDIFPEALLVLEVSQALTLEIALLASGGARSLNAMIRPQAV